MRISDWSSDVCSSDLGKVGDDVIEKLIRKHFDLRPFGILQMLDLLHSVYQRTACYGHFGRKHVQVSYTDGAGKQQSATAFSWEQTDRAEELRKAATLQKRRKPRCLSFSPPRGAECRRTPE